MSITVSEVDILNGDQQDMLDDVVWDELLKLIEAGDFDTELITPPCNTHSRARHKKNGGPRPLRDLKHPDGFPWLKEPHKSEVDKANKLIERTKVGTLTGSNSPAQTR